MIRSLSVAMIATAVILISVSCGGSGPKTPELVFAVGGAPNEIAFWEELVAEFEKSSGKRVTLLRQTSQTDQRRQGLGTSLGAGEPNPDVFLMDVAWIAQFAASNWLEPLDGRSGLEEDRFFPSILRLADRYDGKLIALPVYIDAGLLYYRKDLLPEGPPATWDALFETAKAIQAREQKNDPSFSGFVWQGAQYEGLICNFLEFAGSMGGGLEIGRGKVSLNTPENLRALEFMRGTIGTISPANTYTDMKEEEVRTHFQEGHALFERNWPYAFALHNEEGSAVKGKVGIAPLPHAEGHSSVATLGGWHIAISKTSDSKDAAWEFVQFVTSRETQKRLALKLGWNPGRRDVYADTDVLAAVPHLKELAAVFEGAVPRPNVPWYTQVSEAIQPHLNAALAGSTRPAEALQKAEEAAARVAETYRE
jgi:multiple sugar transport system substrate-binding protein